MVAIFVQEAAPEKFIVAEVSKNWKDGREVTPTGTVSSQFEKIINENHRRGYVLHSFTLHRLIHGQDVMNETIIAVFRRRDVEA